MDFIFEAEGGEILTITPHAFDLHPQIRKLVFKLARVEHKGAVDFLWKNYKCREMTQKEIDEFNNKRNGG